MNSRDSRSSLWSCLRSAALPPLIQDALSSFCRRRSLRCNTRVPSFLIFFPGIFFVPSRCDSASVATLATSNLFFACLSLFLASQIFDLSLLGLRASFDIHDFSRIHKSPLGVLGNTSMIYDISVSSLAITSPWILPLSHQVCPSATERSWQKSLIMLNFDTISLTNGGQFAATHQFAICWFSEAFCRIEKHDRGEVIFSQMVHYLAKTKRH